MHRIYPYLIIGIFVSACASGRAPLATPVDTSFTLQVNQVFEDLPNGTHIDFQHGVRVAEGNLDRWTTYCRLYVYNDFHGASYSTRVDTGIFEISAVGLGFQSSESQDRPWHLYRPFSRGVDDLPSYFLYHVGMRLTSPDQPDVLSLACYKKWSTAYADQYPTLAEIRQALGQLIQLTSPPES